MNDEVVRAPGPALPRPTVGVVMLVPEVASDLEEAIGSVLGQDGVEVRVVVVDRSATGDDELVAPARRDPRVSCVSLPGAGPGAARNRGVAELATTYVVFADGTDRVPDGAFRAMTTALGTTGSDVCLGAVEHVDEEGSRQGAWSREAHATDLRAVSLVEHPVLVKDLFVRGRMTRLDFWRAHGLAFPETEDDETHLTMLRSLVEATGIDVVTDVVCRWRSRAGGASPSDDSHDGHVHARWAEARQAAWEHLASADPSVRDAWLGRMLDVDLPPLLSGERPAAADHEVLASFVRSVVDRAGDGALAWVRGQPRVRAWLAAQGRWEDLRLFSARLGEGRLRDLTVVEDGELRLDPELLPVGDLPDVWRTLSLWQTRASARVLSVATPTDGSAGVRLDGVVSVQGLALGPVLDRCRVEVRSAEGRRPAQVRRRGRSGSASSIGFRVELESQPAPTDELRVEVRVDGLEREAAVRDPGGVLTRPVPPLVVPSPPAPAALTRIEAAADLAARFGLRQVGVRPSLGSYLAEVWQRRDFVQVLASASAYAANSNRYLGQLWSVLRPVLDATVYVLIFGILLGTSRGLDNFVGFIVIGTFFYRGFSESMTSAAGSIVKSMNLVRSLQFPRALLPVSNVIAQFVSLGPALVVMVGFVLISPLLPPAHAAIQISWRWAMLPVAVLLLALFSVGAGLLVARVTAFVPDLLNVLPFFLRLLMYASGVIFSITHYVQNPALQRIMELQPVAVYLDLARQSLLIEPSIPWDWTMWLVGAGWAVLFLVLGTVFFWRAEARYGRE